MTDSDSERVNVVTVDTPVHFGQTLRTLRTSANISLRELSRRIGVTAGYLSQVESGRLPPPSDLRISQIAEELGITADQLMRLSGRLDTELIDYLATNSELVKVLELCRDRQFSAAFLQRLHTTLEEHGEQCFSVAHQEDTQQRSPLAQFLSPELVFCKLERRSPKTIFQFLTENVLKAQKNKDNLSAKAIVDSLEQRESKGPTLIGQNIVLPHACIEGLESPTLAVTSLARSVSWAGGAKVQLVFLVLYGPQQNSERLELLAHIASQVSDQERAKILLNATSKEQLWQELVG